MCHYDNCLITMAKEVGFQVLENLCRISTKGNRGKGGQVHDDKECLISIVQQPP